MDIMKANILENLSKCAAFLFETIDKKKKKLALIEENIVNKNFDIEKINYNTQIEIVYMNNTYTFKVSDFFFSGLKNRKAILECIKTNKNHSFSYYQNNKKILDSEELETHYDNYFKAILTSNINKNYINEFEGIGEYNFILNEEKFLNEINLSYVIMPINTLSGLTSKNFYTVYISNSIDYCHVEKILPQLGGKLVTKLHEIINHIYRLIIHINDYEIPFDTPPKIFKKDALNNKENIKPLKDGGDKYEAIIFGNKIDKIFLSGIFYILDENNWNNNNINDFCSGFLKQNNFEKNFKKLQSDYEKLIEKNEFVKIFQKKNKIDFAKIVSDWLQKDQGINPRLSYNIQEVQYIQIGECGTHYINNNNYY